MPEEVLDLPQMKGNLHFRPYEIPE
jgi:hypothetical protein